MTTQNSTENKADFEASTAPTSLIRIFIALAVLGLLFSASLGLCFLLWITGKHFTPDFLSTFYGIFSTLVLLIPSFFMLKQDINPA